MSNAERTKWEARYAGREGGPGDPDPNLTALAPWLPSAGRALDIAGGTGRNALWLVRQGLSVTLLDVAPSALAQASAAAAAEWLVLETIALDLDDAPLPEGPFALIVQLNYLNRALLPAYAERLAEGGRLVIVHPTRRNLRRHPRPSARFLLEDGELAGGAPGLTTLHCAEGWSPDGRHLAALVAERPVGGARK